MSASAAPEGGTPNSGNGLPYVAGTGRAYLRRSTSGRFNFSQEFDQSADLSPMNAGYTVHMPPTPDLQPMQYFGMPHHQHTQSTEGLFNPPATEYRNNHVPAPTMVSQSKSALRTATAVGQQQDVSASIYTGGFSTMTRGHMLEKFTDGRRLPPSNGHLNIESNMICSMKGCDEGVICDQHGEVIYPCECSFKICRDCYDDACKAGGVCPGCKEAYKSDEYTIDDIITDSHSAAPLSLPAPPDNEVANDDCRPKAPLSLPAPEDQSPDRPSRSPAASPATGPSAVTAARTAVMDRRLSIVNPKVHEKMQLALVRSPSKALKEFDYAHWLYETKGTYGFGNAHWPKQHDASGGDAIPDFKDKGRRPLCRKVRVPAGIISPYRLLAVIRFVILGLFLEWRIGHPNHEAIWLWGMSIVCEIWFALSWVLDQLPKLCPVNRSTDLAVLKDKFEMPSPQNPSGRSDLPGLDIFVSTADPEKEPPLVTANTILSILAADYPVEKLACYLSDDGGALLTFEAMAEAASFAAIWVPFCRKHSIEPRNPESYFSLRGDPTKNKKQQDFVKDRRRVKREYDEFKVRINSLPEAIRRRSAAYNTQEDLAIKKRQMGASEPIKTPPKATWMSDGTHWPGTWTTPSKEHSRGDHAGIIQVLLPPPSHEPVYGSGRADDPIDSSDVDIRLPMLVYVSREKRPGFDHNKKAGAMNALVRSSAIMSNGPFILNLDCDHYVYNSLALREGMCFMMDRGGENICYVQFPQRFEGIDPHDRYANHNTVFFDGNMRALDGLQGPMYVGTGCMFRRIALYAFDPPRYKDRGGWCSCCCGRQRRTNQRRVKDSSVDISEDQEAQLVPKKFGTSHTFLSSIIQAELQGRPLAYHPGDIGGRQPGTLIGPREPLDPGTMAEVISVISCWYEDKTEWGRSVGWIYGSVTEDVVTGYRMHSRGWRSIYCATKRDAFRGTAPINLTDRLQQVLRWATGSVEIFFSRNNGLLAGRRMKMLQRVAYLNVGIYPFTSIFLVVYSFLPALSLFTDQFIVKTLDVLFLIYLLVITVTLCMLAMLEVKWAGITLDEWWRNEQFWLIGGTSAHLVAVLQGLLKVVAGIDISFTLTSKSAAEGEEDDPYADLYVVKWTSLMIPPLTIMMVNMIAIAVAIARTIYSSNPSWSKLLGGVFFSVWVLLHLYPFAKGLMGRRGRTPTIIWVWSGLLSITISLIWVALSHPDSKDFANKGSGFSISL